MSWITPPVLYKSAAMIYGLTAPGHMQMGFEIVYPALRKIPLVGKNAVGQRGAENCWNYVGVSLLIGALLNWQWARTGGPQTIEENAIFWAYAATHAINGIRYAQVGAYQVSAVLWLAPLLGIGAMLIK